MAWQSLLGKKIKKKINKECLLVGSYHLFADAAKFYFCTS
jgi:hypothetical protein